MIYKHIYSCFKNIFEYVDLMTITVIKKYYNIKFKLYFIFNDIINIFFEHISGFIDIIKSDFNNILMFIENVNIYNYYKNIKYCILNLNCVENKNKHISKCINNCDYDCDCDYGWFVSTET